MFIYLSKLLPTFFAPLTIALVLLLVALLYQKWRKRALVAAIVMLALPGWPPFSNFLIGTLEDQNPDIGIDAQPHAEAIVVLGGTIHGPGNAHRESRLLDASDRLLVALRLYRAGKAPLILCSGGNLSLAGPTDRPPEAETMKLLFEEWGVPADAILTEGRSVNTHENAMRSRDLLAARGIHRILLVTSAWHMPRASATFRKFGFEVIPAPADYLWSPDLSNWMPNSNSLMISERAVREWLGLWTYRLRKWA